MLTVRLMDDLKVAMREKNTIKKNVITMLRAGLKNDEIKKRAELTEKEQMAVVRRELKQTKDALVEFEKAGRTDLVETEKAKIEVLETYLPKQLTEAEILAEIQKMGIDKSANAGKVTGMVIGKLKEVADGSLINKVVRSYMNS